MSESGSLECIECGAEIRFPHDEYGEIAADASATCDYCGATSPHALALLRMRKKEARRDARAMASRYQARRRAAILVAGSALLLGIAGWTRTEGTLHAAHEASRRARAQVRNVVERQEVVRLRWADADADADARDRMAELAGAENRVRIERARYDEAAAAYNAEASGAWPSLVARLSGLPARHPLSNEAHW